MASFDEIRAEVLKKINPDKNEQKKMQELAHKLTEKVREAAHERGIEFNIRVEGSVAKNTWLRDCPEIDIFLQVPTTVSKEDFGTIILEVAKKATKGYEQIERFAEHPYLEAVIDETYVNIVPCYKVEQGEWISATDRTPFHTDYIKLHLDEQMEEEVRLLKRFMKGVDVYGAEIKVGGFSGYLCELLVLNYGTFIEVLRSAANWKERTVIDYEKNYENVDAKKIFEEPLVMVDPVDKARNVAAAVKKEMLYEFIAASRKFLKKPGMNFFYPPETEALNITDLANKIKTRGSTIIFIKFGGTTAVPDVLWGQLYKSLRSLRKIIQRHDWKVLREDVWSDEKKLSIFVFEVENQFRPNMKRHLGPPLSRRKDCEKFLQKHIEADSTVSGPRVENGQWIVYVNSKFTDVVKMLKETLKNGGKNIGVAELVSKAIADSSEILVNNEVGKLYSSSPEFAKFLTRYLKGKPLWLT